MSRTHSKLAAAIGYVAFFVLAASSAAAGCADASPPAMPDASTTDDAAADGLTDAAVDTTIDTRVDTGLDTGSDTGTDAATDAPDSRLEGGAFEAGTPPDAGPLPDVGCADAAADADRGGEVCPLPEATCLGGWLVSFLSSVCVDGACTYVRVFKDCAEEDGSVCVVGTAGASCKFAGGK
jgi:hypothetical protein